MELLKAHLLLLVAAAAIGAAACGARTEPAGFNTGGKFGSSISVIPAGNRPSAGQPSYGGSTGVGGVTSTGGTTSIGGTSNAQVAPRRIVAGSTHSCALRDGEVLCWGSNAFGQLGDDTTSARLQPVLWQRQPLDTTDIAVGGYHTCVVAAETAYCLGYNGFGQLGDNSTEDSLFAVRVSGLTSGVTAVAAGTN